MSKYKLKVINRSGMSQTVAVYQDFPIRGYPLVWFSKYVVDKNTAIFSWNENWGLGWGTTEGYIADGVLFSMRGPIQSVDPSIGALNGIRIGYNRAPFGNDGDFTQTPLSLGNLGSGELGIETTKEFTVVESKDMSVAVFSDNKPVFVMQGKPSGKYILKTHPTYYISITDLEESTTVSGEYVSNPTEVRFDDTFDMECIIDQHLVAKCSAVEHSEL